MPKKSVVLAEVKALDKKFGQLKKKSNVIPKPKPRNPNHKRSAKKNESGLSNGARANIIKKVANFAASGGEGLDAATSLGGIFGTICTPSGVTKVSQYGDPGSAVKTATAKAPSHKIVSWSGSTHNDLATTDGCAFGFRDPLRQSVIYDGNSGQLGYNYQVYFSDGTQQTTMNDPAPTISPTYPTNPGEVVVPRMVYALPAGSPYQPHGPKLYMGASDANDQMRYIWVDKQATLAVEYTTSTTNVPEFLIKRWTPEGPVDIGSIPGTSGSFQTTTLVAVGQESGYYSFMMGPATGSVAGNVTFSANCCYVLMTAGSTSGSVWCHNAAPGFNINGNDSKMNRVRVLGTAITFTNSAAYVALEGNITAVQVPKNINWLTLIKPNGLGVSAIPAIQAVDDAVDHSAKNGHYVFLKPTSLKSFELMTPLKFNSTGAIIDSAYQLSNFDDYIVIYPVISSSLSGAQDAKWHVHCSWEYATSDIITEKSVSPLNYKEWEKIIMALRYMPQHFENPTHLKDIWNWFKNNVPKVVSAAESNLPTILKGLQLASSALSAF